MKQKDKCPRCRSMNWTVRLRKNEAVCRGCGLGFPNPWDRPKAYEKVVKRWAPPPLKIVIERVESPLRRPSEKGGETE